MHMWIIIAVIGYSLITIALFVLIYSSIKLREIRRREKDVFGPLPEPSQVANEKNPRWKYIQDLINSTDVNNWRQAIIESDIILGEMLTTQGYQGETIAEQLKQVDPADFGTLNDAWEAHKIRNEIVHSGAAFDFSEVLARRTIDRYENVFREFEAI